MKGTPVRLVRPLAPRRIQRPTPSPFVDLNSFGQMLTEIAKMHETVLTLVNSLEKKHAAFDDIKRGPPGVGLPGMSVDHDAVVADVLKQVGKPENGKSPSVTALAALLLPSVLAQVERSLPNLKGDPGVSPEPLKIGDVMELFKKGLKDGSIKLETKHINGFENRIAEVRNAAALGETKIYGKNTWARGGGDTVVAGANVTFGKDADGNKIINASGGTTLSIITVSGIIDDSNVTFTAATEPTLLNINGAFYKKTGGSYTWSYAAGTITLNVAVGTGGSIFGI